MSFSQRMAKKESVALKRLGDAIVYCEFDKPHVQTFAIVDLDVENEGEQGIDLVTEITLSIVEHPNVNRNDEVIYANKIYRLTRKLRLSGSLVTYSGIEV